MFYKEECNTRFIDYDKNELLRPESILDLFEDICSKHSDSEKRGIFKTSRDNETWLVLKWHVKINKYPSYGEKLFAVTWVQDTKSTATFKRNFLLLDDNNNELVEALAVMARYSRKDKQLIRVEKEEREIYEPEKRALFPPIVKMEKAPKEYSYIYPFQTRRSDLDYNGHIHNTCYLSYALEALPEDVLEKGFPSEFHIAYHNPVFYGDKITLKYKKTDNWHQTGIFSDELLCCQVIFK